MFTSDQISQLKELTQSAQSILVLCGPNPTLDQAAAANALTESLQALDKQVLLLAPETKSESYSVLEKQPEFKTEMGNKDLTISFSYRPEAIDKVSYHIDEQQQRFFLVIKPQKGQKPLETESVAFEYTGAEADLIFLIGVPSFESLGHLYEGYEQLFQSTMTVTINTYEPEIGAVKINAGDVSGLSELVAQLLMSLEMYIDEGNATNLLTAIEAKTDRLQSFATTADTFQLVAELMRRGARRKRVNGATIKPSGDFSQALTSSKKNQNQSSKKKKGDLQHQPSEFSVGGRG